MNALDAALEPASSLVGSMFTRWPGPGVLQVLVSRADVRQELLQFWFNEEQRDTITSAARPDLVLPIRAAWGNYIDGNRSLYE